MIKPIIAHAVEHNTHDNLKPQVAVHNVKVDVDL